MRPRVLGDLHCKTSDAPGSAEDHHDVAVLEAHWLNAHPCRYSRERKRGAKLRVEGGGPARDGGGGCSGELGERPVPERHLAQLAERLVTDLPAINTGSERVDGAGEVGAGNEGKVVLHAVLEGALEDHRVEWVDAAGGDPDADLAIRRFRDRQVMDRAGAAEFVESKSTHEKTPLRGQHNRCSPKLHERGSLESRPRTSGLDAPRPCRRAPRDSWRPMQPRPLCLCTRGRSSRSATETRRASARRRSWAGRHGP